MSKFNNTQETNKKTTYNKNGKKPFKKQKPKYVRIKLDIAYSDFYASGLDSLYNLLDSISFDKVAVPVNISKTQLFGNDQLKGSTVLGTVISFNGDNTFTLSVPESFAEKITEDSVLSIHCKKDFGTGEITYVNSLNVIEGESVKNHYNDVEQAMLDIAEEEEAEEETAE